MDQPAIKMLTMLRKNLLPVLPSVTVNVVNSQKFIALFSATRAARTRASVMKKHTHAQSAMADGLIRFQPLRTTFRTPRNAVVRLTAFTSRLMPTTTAAKLR